MLLDLTGRNSTQVAEARRRVATAIAQLRWRQQPDPADDSPIALLSGYRYSSGTAKAAIWAASYQRKPIELHGEVTGGISLPSSTSLSSDFSLFATVYGDVALAGKATGDISIEGTIEGSVKAFGTIEGDLVIAGSAADLCLHGAVGGSVAITGAVRGDLAVWGTVARDLAIQTLGLVRGDIEVWDTSTVSGDLVVWGTVEGYLAVCGTIGADLVVRETGIVRGDLELWEDGLVEDDIDIWGVACKDVLISGSSSVQGIVSIREKALVGGRVEISDSSLVARNIEIGGTVVSGLLVLDDVSIGGDLLIRDEAVISVGVRLEGRADVRRHVVLLGAVIGSFVATDAATFGGNITISRSAYLSGDLEVGGSSSLSGSLVLEGQFGGDLRVAGSGSVGEDLVVAGSAAIAGTFSLEGSAHVGDRLLFLGTSRSIALTGQVRDRTVITPRAGHIVPITSMHNARFGKEVFIGERSSIDQCDLRQCADLDLLNLVGTHVFGGRDARLSRNPTSDPNTLISHREMSTIYRQLRVGFESRRNRPSARKLYVREMDSRRLAVAQEGSRDLTESAILWSYLLMARYGQSARLALLWLVLLVAGSTIGYAVGGVDLTGSYDVQKESLFAGWSWGDRIAVVLFSIQAMFFVVLPLNAPNLTTSENAIQIVSGFLGPVLLAQAVFALRERVRR